MKVFIFAIGGTGARVLRSLTMLLASGIDIPKDVELVPVIIDFDKANGDTGRSRKIIEKYTDIRKTTFPTDEAGEGFFFPKLRTLNSYTAENFKQPLKDAFQLDFGNIDRTFHRFLKADELNYENHLLLENLFDSSPEPSNPDESSPTELFLNLSLGFKGNPNIGSIIFNDLVNAPEYKYFEDICGENDKVFIISSIFGGTGSSGYPQLVKNLRRSDKNTVKNVRIGALVVLPYFMIARRNNSAIDSNNFKSKTKAALTYYASELEGLVNDTYYIGSDESGDAYANHEGGEDQTNNAHIVEMIGAKSLIHYVRNSSTQAAATMAYQQFGQNYFEFGARTSSSNYDFRHFFPQTQSLYFNALTRFQIFAKFYTQTLRQKSAYKASFAKNLKITPDTLHTDPFYAELNNFIANYYLEWMRELNENDPKFVPFKQHEDYKRMIVGNEYKLKDDYLISRLNELEKKYRNISSNHERFMRIAYETCSMAFQDRISILPTGENI